MDVRLVDEAVAVVCHVVLHVSLASVANLDLRAVWVRRPKARNFQAISFLLWVVLH